MKKKQNKKWWESKTVWFNALTILVAFATANGYTPNQELANEVATVAVLTAPIINIALRLITNKGVTI